jgi:hypothetical protein
MYVATVVFALSVSSSFYGAGEFGRYLHEFQTWHPDDDEEYEEWN